MPLLAVPKDLAGDSGWVWIPSPAASVRSFTSPAISAPTWKYGNSTYTLLANPVTDLPGVVIMARGTDKKGRAATVGI